MNLIDLERQFYDVLLESEHWSAEALRDYQQSQLEQLLRHARTNVPFYENRLDAVFASDGSIDWDKWTDLPVLKRSDLIEHRAAMQARTLPPGHGPTYEASTSGSTGPAVTTTHSAVANLANKATSYRHHHRHGLDWSRPLARWDGDDPDKAKYPDGAIIPAWGPRWLPRAELGPIVQVNRFARAAEALEFFDRHDPLYFSGRPRTAQALALEARRLGAPRHFDAVLTYGTGIGPGELADCSEIFGARMFGIYSSREGLAIAGQCPTGRHFHINEEMALVEIVDEAGRPVAPGEMGRVVVTPLYSTAQPLLRYEQGDLAIPGNPCACGRHHRVIEQVVGRVTHLFQFADGSVVAPTLPEIATSLLGARSWQLAQVGPLELELRYVPTSAGDPGNWPELTDLVRARVHPEASVRFRELESLDRDDGGKFIQYVNEWSPRR